MAANARINTKLLKRTDELDSAFHVLKGAIVRVLHTPLTVSVTYDNKITGRIAVRYDGASAPSEEIIKQIESFANDAIQRDIPFQTLMMTRSEAEERFQSRVNETFIYDMQPVPDHISELSICLLEDWNVNCCAGPHVSSTSKLNRIQIARVNHRPDKKTGAELEFVFKLIDDVNADAIPTASKSTAKSSAAASTTSSTKSTTTTTAAASKKKGSTSSSSSATGAISLSIDSVTSRIVESILNAANITDAAQRSAIAERANAEIVFNLEAFRNDSYAAGFNARGATRS